MLVALRRFRVLLAVALLLNVSALLVPPAPPAAADVCSNVPGTCRQVTTGQLQLHRLGTTYRTLPCPSEAPWPYNQTWDKSSHAVTVDPGQYGNHAVNYIITN